MTLVNQLQPDQPGNYSYFDASGSVRNGSFQNTFDTTWDPEDDDEKDEKDDDFEETYGDLEDGHNDLNEAESERGVDNLE